VALASFDRDALNWREMRLAAIGAEVSRVRECAGAPHRVAEAALALVRRHVHDLEGLSARVRECAGAPHRVAEAAIALVRRHVHDLEGLSAGAMAAAALWLAAYKEYGMLIRLAEAAGATVVGVKNAARRIRA